MKKFLPFLIISLVGYLVWKPIFGVFYLQDEWHGLGHMMVEGWGHIFAGANILQIFFGETRPLARLLGLYFFGQNMFNSLPVAIFSLTIHIVNSCLIYLLGLKFTKDKLIGFLAALIFLTGSVASNSVYWFSTSVGTLPATSLILFSVLKYLKFIETNKRQFLFYSLILLYVSMLFKEIGIFLFVVYPACFLIFKKVSVSKTLKIFWPFLLFFVLTASLRVFALKAMSSQDALFLTGSSHSYYLTLITRAIIYPISSFSLQFIPVDFAKSIAREITRINYPFIPENVFLLVSETVVLDMLSVIFCCLFLVIIYLMHKTIEGKQKPYLVFLVIFSFLSFLPYVIISKSFAYLESRYFYLSAAAASIILAWFFGRLINQKHKAISVIGLAVMILYFYSHLNQLSKYLQDNVSLGNERREFIHNLLSLNPTLSGNKNIFYIDSDTDYYVAGNKTPFQNGIGFNLMVWYYKSGKIPPKFILDSFLFDIGSQGYSSDGEYGFGYFSEEQSLKDSISRYKIPTESIHAFKYDSKTHSLRKTSFDNYYSGKK